MVISVIIPTYNRDYCIARSLESVLRQTCQDFEIVIVDDDSTDNTRDVLGPYLVDPRIRYIKHVKNQGGLAARITGIRKAVGQHVVFLDSDDELLPNSLEVRLSALQKSGVDRALVYGDVILAANDKRSEHRFKRLHGYSYAYLLKELSLCSFSVMMVTTACFAVAGYYDRDFLDCDLPSWHDDYLVLSIGRHFPVIHCGFPVAIMHDSPESITTNEQSLELGCRRMVSKYREDILNIHGRPRLFLWNLRILRCRVRAERQRVVQTNKDHPRLVAIYSWSLSKVDSVMTAFLSHFFDNPYA